ncbi:hypothetical protein KFK09_018495 [Dendrobium nobile]|uniref:AAA+ ATPase domain-containing protein n=1 Tax=Dendrobium nobile TaxID=94219 RepID=A0A8T3AUZ1_DENNO|nr:hypothetical protein KFK09_018495 [Dendrobium nobile]
MLRITSQAPPRLRAQADHLTYEGAVLSNELCDLLRPRKSALVLREARQGGCRFCGECFIGSGKEAPFMVLGVVGSDNRSNMMSGEMRRERLRFQDFGGINKPELRLMIGILLHDPPGCGKTKLAYAITNEIGCASEKNIHDLFNKAYQSASSIIFIDDIDMKRRLLTQCMTCMDESQQILKAMDNRMSSYILVIGATSKLDAVDQTLRKPVCFDKEITLGVPDLRSHMHLSFMFKNGFLFYFFLEATKLVQPSTRREGISSIPNIKWEDVGGLDSLRNAFNLYTIQCIKHPEDYEGLEFLGKYAGESEQEVRTIFSRARICSPCIIFFDEVDALTRKRGRKRGREGASVMEWALYQLLVELDGADKRHGVYVIGATNRLEVIDLAVLRPGRFGRLFYVPLLSADEWGLILKALADKRPVNEAVMTTKEEKQMHVNQRISYDEPLVIKTSHFEKALEKIIPSVSKEQKRYYAALSQNFRAA